MRDWVIVVAAFAVLIACGYLLASIERHRKSRSRHLLLKRDAHARALGLNLDGTARRETVADGYERIVRRGEGVGIATSSPYAAKCKRRRTDGPTPCLCCPQECVG